MTEMSNNPRKRRIDATNARYGESRPLRPNSRSQRTSVNSASYANHRRGYANAREADGIWRRYKVALIVVASVLVVAIALLIGSLSNSDKIADGVHVGDVDLSGMTVSEATDAIYEKYDEHLQATTVYIFADEDSANSADIDMQMIQNEALAEQLSFEEAQSNKKLWIASADSLKAYIPAEDMANDALDLGNSFDFFQRMGATQEQLTVSPRAAFDEEELQALISDINSSLGEEVANYDLFAHNGEVSVVEGKEGELLDNEEFSRQLSDILLVDASSLQRFVAEIKPVTYDIDEDDALRTKEAIEEAIPDSVVFSSENGEVSIDRSDIMEWVDTRPSERDGDWYLEPYIDRTLASKHILEAVNLGSIGDDISVSIDSTDDGGYVVTTSSEVSVPNIDETISVLDSELFDSYREDLEPSPSSIDSAIEVTMSEAADSFTLDEALSYGIVTEFGSFTTQYTNTSSTENRKGNIHLVADAIGGSIIEANGGSWSFLEHSGPMDEEAGYKEANQIVGDQMEQGIGGGVCQVATTVFNAVYNAGMDIAERHNHSLYMSSYPSGLDAAVSYPTLDLVWSNNTTSDILLLTSYTDSSVTVTLIGIDPEVEVETDTGEWEDGEKHTTKYEEDENLRAGSAYIKTAPSDGRKISVVRTIKDKDGNVLSQDWFGSVYAPVNRVIVYGSGSDLSEIKARYPEEEDDKS